MNLYPLIHLYLIPGARVALADLGQACAGAGQGGIEVRGWHIRWLLSG